MAKIGAKWPKQEAKMRRTIAIMGLVLAFATPLQAENDAAARLTVTGQGVADVVPDMARISLGVTKDAPEAPAALEGVAEVAQAIFARLEAVGIAPRDMQTAQVSLAPRYDYNRNSDGPPKLTGFTASTTLAVQVRALDQLGAIMSAVTQDGANQLNGLQFDVQDRASAEDAARADAVKDAMARAKVLADAAGVTLGPIISIHEGGARAAPVYGRMTMEAAQSDMPIAAGELEIGSSVTMVFELLEE